MNGFRKYGQLQKRWSLFNVSRWALHGTEPAVVLTADPRIIQLQDVLPECCGLVPVLYQGMFDQSEIELALDGLRSHGSVAAPGFMKPEGVVIFHVAGNVGFKRTLDKDEAPKTLGLTK